MPESEREDDLFHGHTRLPTIQMCVLTQQLQAINTPFLWGGSINIPSHTWGFATGLLDREPTAMSRTSSNDNPSGI